MQVLTSSVLSGSPLASREVLSALGLSMDPSPSQCATGLSCKGLAEAGSDLPAVLSVSPHWLYMADC